MNKKLMVDCTCGYSFYCTESELRADLSGTSSCAGLIRKEGKLINCPQKFSYLRLLKIMQLTNHWDATNEEIYAWADNVEIQR